MLHAVSAAMHDVENAVIRNADDGSGQAGAATGGAEDNAENPAEEQADGLPERSPAGSLRTAEEGLHSRQQIVLSMTTVSQVMEDTGSMLIGVTQAVAEGQARSDTPQALELVQGTPDSTTENQFEQLLSLTSAMQNQGKLLQILGNLMKNMRDEEDPIISNMRGADDPAAATGSAGETGGSVATAIRNDAAVLDARAQTSVSTAGPAAPVPESWFLNSLELIDEFSVQLDNLTEETGAVFNRAAQGLLSALESSAAPETGDATLVSIQQDAAAGRSAADWRSIALASGIDDPRGGDVTGILDEQADESGEGAVPAGSDQSADQSELMERLGNLEATRDRLVQDIEMLEAFIQSHAPGDFQLLTIHLPAPDGQGGYHMVPFTIPLDPVGAVGLLAQQQRFLTQVSGEIAGLLSQLNTGSRSGTPPADSSSSVQSSAAGGSSGSWQDAAQEGAIEDPRG